MTILQLLASDSFITFNKNIAKRFGLEEAVLLGALCSYQVSFGGNEFYKGQDLIMEDTTLTLYSLRKAFKTLQDNGIVSVVKKGLPSKNFYKVNEDVLVKFLTTTPIENDRSRDSENNSTCDSENDSTNINNNTENENTINDKVNILSCDGKTLSEQEQIINSIIDYLNLKTHKHYFYYTKKTRTLIKALLENYTEEDIKQVIDKKAKQWLGNTEMEQYLRPITLFNATKFESYYNQKGTPTYKQKQNYHSSNNNIVDEFNEMRELAQELEEENRGY